MAVDIETLNFWQPKIAVLSTSYLTSTSAVSGICSTLAPYKFLSQHFYLIAVIKRAYYFQFLK